MGTPYEHALLSVERFGGRIEDYMPIHELMDSSKQAFSDSRHRALTHNSWFVTTILEKIFGATIKNSEGKHISVRNIAQWHVMEDYGGSFPSASDFLINIRYEKWMNNGEDGEVPPSQKGLPPFDKKHLVPPEEVKNTGTPSKSTAVEIPTLKKYPLSEQVRRFAGKGRYD